MPFDRFVQTRIFDSAQDDARATGPCRASEVGRLATNYAFVGGTRMVPLDPARDLGLSASRRASPMAAPGW